MDQPTDQASVQNPLPSYPSDAPKKSKKLLRLIIFFVILVLLGLGAKQFLFSSKSKKEEVPATTPTPTEYQYPTDTPAPTGNDTTPTPTAKPTVNAVDKSTGLDRSTITITVKNGSGEAGVGAKAADYLKGLGYNVSSTGNADNYNYVNTTIQVKSAKSTFLPLLKKDLGFNYTVGTASADLSSDSSSDAVVIIGK